MKYYKIKTRLGKIFIGSFPYIWVLLFCFIPLLIIIKISLSKICLNSPPYLPIIDLFKPYSLRLSFYLKNYLDLISHEFYTDVVLSSLKISFISTFGAAIIGYTIAYSISCCTKKIRHILLFLVILPFFISFLMRIYAWMTLLSTYGIVNRILLNIGIIKEPIEFVGNLFSVCIGIIYCYLPFMVLPIYSVLDKINITYIESAQDLGARPFQTFWSITFPLSLTGLITGCILVFIPVFGEFVIPEVLGNPSTLTLGRAIFWEFFGNHNWPMTCAMTIMTIALLVIPTTIFQYYQIYKKIPK